MAGVKIGDLTPLATIADSDELVVVDVSEGTDGVTKKITFANLRTSEDSVTTASNAITSLRSNLTSETSTAFSQFITFAGAETGFEELQTATTFTYKPGLNLLQVANITATGDIEAANFIGDGSQLTNIVASSIDETYLQNFIDSNGYWTEYTDGSRTVLRTNNNLYIDATAGGTGLQTYIQGGNQNDIDLIAAGGNKFTGIAASQPWTSILAYGPDNDPYTSALLGLNQTGIHTRYGHMLISQDSVSIDPDAGQTVKIHGGTSITGSLTTGGTSFATNFREGVRLEDSTSVTLSPSLGQMVKHSPAVGTGNLTYLYDAGWQTGESLTLHLFTDSDRLITWPSTLWIDSAFDSAIGTTGAHLVNVWKLDETNFFAAYVGEAK
jgi:hypothetical protein